VNRCLQSTQVLDAADVRPDDRDIVHSIGRQDGEFLRRARESVRAEIRNADTKPELREPLGSGKAETGSPTRENGNGSGCESKVCHR
jgi:hypothetical protein